MNVIQNEPVMTAAIVTVLTWIAARFGSNLDTQTATAFALIVLVIASWVARRFSTPVGHAQTKIDQAWIADPATDEKPKL